MATTPNLSMTELAESQASAHITVNDALQRLDNLVMPAVVSFGDNAPPGGPSNGDMYVVGGSPSGAWASNANDLAYYAGGWLFVTPAAGFVVYVADDDVYAVYDGTSWQYLDSGATSQQAVGRIDSPLNDDKAPLFYTARPITITDVRAVVNDSDDSVSWNIMHATTRDAAGTQVFTSDQTANDHQSGTTHNSGFNDATIPAGRYVWIEIEAAPTGSPAWVEWYVNFTVDPLG